MTKFNRLIGALLAALAVSWGAAGATAQSAYPSKPIKMVFSFAAGGAGDTIGRLLAGKAGAELGQAIFVDNRSGGNGVIGGLAVAKAEPDGYTILLVTGANVVGALLQGDVPYNFNDDFIPVIGVGDVPLLLAVPGESNIRSLADLVAVSKSMPGGLNYASGGNGSIGHLSGASLARELKISAKHVPYRGNGPAMLDLIGNRIQFFFPSVIESLDAVKSGQVRALAVTSVERLKDLPDVPTMKELGLGGIDPRTWYGVLVPAKTPKAIVDRLYDVFSKSAVQPDVQERLAAMSFMTRVTSGPEFGKFMRDESVRWKQVIDENQIRMDSQ